jgi:hypothetical protein
VNLYFRAKETIGTDNKSGLYCSYRLHLYRSFLSSVSISLFLHPLKSLLVHILLHCSGLHLTSTPSAKRETDTVKQKPWFVILCHSICLLKRLLTTNRPGKRKQHSPKRPPATAPISSLAVRHSNSHHHQSESTYYITSRACAILLPTAMSRSKTTRLTKNPPPRTRARNARRSRVSPFCCKDRVRKERSRLT